MTTWTIVGDPHARPDNLDKIETLFDIVEDLNNPCILLGDLLHTKEVVRGKCLNTYLDRLIKSNLQFVCIVGNHDFFNSVECRGHSLEALKNLNNVTIVDRPRIIDNIQFVPYFRDVETLKTLSRSPEIIATMGHFDIQGFDYGNGKLSESGFTKDELRGLGPIISGHYHKYQQDGNITYLGTPFSHDFGETNQDKYLGIFSSIDGSLNLIETPFPKHVTHRMAVGDPTPPLDPINYNRVIVEGSPADLAKFDLPGVKVMKKTIGNSPVGGISEDKTPAEQFTEWAVTAGGLDDQTIKLGLNILEEVA